MSPLEKTLRFSALPVSVFLATIAMWWGWATYPHSEYFFLHRILPFYALFLVLSAASMQVLTNDIKQFMIIITGISALFIGELFLRVVLDIYLF